MRLMVTLLALAGVGYAGLYMYYDAGLARATEARLSELGLDAARVESLEFSPLAPLLTEAEVSATVTYSSFKADVTLHVDGHPLFTDELSLGLDGLKGLLLEIGPAGEGQR